MCQAKTSWNNRECQKHNLVVWLLTVSPWLIMVKVTTSQHLNKGSRIRVCRVYTQMCTVLLYRGRLLSVKGTLLSFLLSVGHFKNLLVFQTGSSQGAKRWRMKGKGNCEWGAATVLLIKIGKSFIWEGKTVVDLWVGSLKRKQNKLPSGRCNLGGKGTKCSDKGTRAADVSVSPVPASMKECQWVSASQQAFWFFRKKFKLHKFKSQDILKRIATEQLEKVNFISKGKICQGICNFHI